MEPAPAVTRQLWPILAGSTGALLLVQTAFGAAAELVVGDAGLLHVFVCTAALGVLVAGLWLRHAGTLLTAFPIALLAAFATMSAETLAAAYTATRWFPWLLTFVAYLLATSTWLSRPGEEELDVRRTPLDGGADAQTGSPVTLIRVLAGGALLVAPAVALLADSPATHFSTDADPGVLFAHLALVFAWSVALYAFFVGPMLDAERERRRLASRPDEPVSAATRRWRRLGWVTLGLCIVGCFVVLWLAPG